MTQCTARSKRTGEQCRDHAMKGRNVCYHHGGKTPRGFALPHTKTGRHSKDLPTRLSGRYLESLNDPDLLNLSDDIALTDAFIEDARKGLDHGESGRLFAELKATWDQLMTAQRNKDAAAVQMHMAELGALIRQGVGAYAARNEATQLIDQRRKLVESESKRRVQMQDMITSEKAMLLTSALLDAVVRHVDDPRILAAIGAEFGAITSRDDPAAA
jgi:hypothetical protein